MSTVDIHLPRKLKEDILKITDGIGLTITAVMVISSNSLYARFQRDKRNFTVLLEEVDQEVKPLKVKTQRQAVSFKEDTRKRLDEMKLASRFSISDIVVFAIYMFVKNQQKHGVQVFSSFIGEVDYNV